jgi:hypothetical protein
MKTSLRRNIFSLTILAVFISVSPAGAQYAGVPGDIPPIPDSYQLDVSITQPYSSAFSIPGITNEEAELLQNPDEDEIIYRRHGVTIAFLEDQELSTYVFKGKWGLTYDECVNIALTSQISPSGRYYAVGADGTCSCRGAVSVVDMETGEKYRTTDTGIWNCTDWIEGDYLLIESVGSSTSNTDKYMSGDIESMSWINYSYCTSAEGRSHDIVLYHGGSSWMILPEDRYYNYSIKGVPGSFDNGIFFDVTASPNIIPSLAGFECSDDFNEWIVSMDHGWAIPKFDFRVYVDTRTNSISDIRQMTPGMVVEGYMNAMKGGNFNRMQNYLTRSLRSSTTDEQRDEIESVLWLFSGTEYRISDVSVVEDHAYVTSEYSFLEQSSEYHFTLVKEQNRWLIDSWGSNGVDESSGTSPDPQGCVAFTSNRNGNSDIYLLDIETENVNRLTSNRACDHRPALSEDGRRLIFVSDRSGQPDVYMMNLDSNGEPTGTLQRLTYNPDEEFDLGWRGSSYNYFFSSFGTSDLDRIAFFYGDQVDLGLDSIWSIYLYNQYMDTIDRTSLEPGDYRYPCYNSQFGTVYARRRWEEGSTLFNVLGYFHGALATRSFNFQYDGITGPLRSASDSLLFIPCVNESDFFYAYYDVVHKVVVDSIPAGELDLFNVSLNPLDWESGWYIAQTAPEGDAGSEIILIQGLGSGSPRIIELTENSFYDGEPDWRIVSRD